jgi:tRNA-uridine 2-sulfurtransferase
LQRNGHTWLQKGLDPNKDQSYFLHAVGEQEFAQTLFPIGNMEKPQVRALAEEFKLVTHRKKDSTGICFIGERRFRDFLQQYLPAQPGLIQTPESQTLGEHTGLMYHTIGQRQGLGIGGVAGSKEEPWYVAEKDLINNVLIVVQGADHPLLYKERLRAVQLHWINGAPPEALFRCHAKVRYRQSDQPCEVDIQGDKLLVRFDAPQRAITPGQSIVLYQDDICLGGAVIEAAFNA